MMKTRAFVVLLFLAVAPTGEARAGNLPSHADLCVDDQGKPSPIVSKEKLSKAILKNSSAATTLYIDVDTVNPKFAPKWRAIFTDPNFCATDKACLGDPVDDPSSPKPADGKKPAPDRSAANLTLRDLRETLVEAIHTGTTRGGLYRTGNPKIGTKYLLTGQNEDPIYCVGEDPPPPPKAYVIKMPPNLRLRAIPDDINVSASDDAFKPLKPASLGYTADGVQGTRVTKLQATLGYAFSLPFDNYTPPALSYLNGQVIPFLSASQGVTKANGKPATLADSNVVIAGTTFNAIAALDDWPGVTHQVSARPQYVWNTKDKSEIASLTMVYQPWTTEGLRLNTPIQLGNILGANWLTLFFDIRNDVGDYNKRSIDPVLARTQQSFDRAGSKFGFALSTNDQGPHIVLNVTETLLYGFIGSIRRLDYLDSSLTFYFDSTSNFGLTLQYTKGTDENSLQRAQTYMAGLSAKF